MHSPIFVLAFKGKDIDNLGETPLGECFEGFHNYAHKLLALLVFM